MKLERWKAMRRCGGGYENTFIIMTRGDETRISLREKVVL